MRTRDGFQAGKGALKDKTGGKEGGEQCQGEGRVSERVETGEAAGAQRTRSKGGEKARCVWRWLTDDGLAPWEQPHGEGF